MTRYRLVAEHRAQWGVEERCRVLKVSRSGYYDWQQRPPSPRAEQTQRLETTIKELFEASQRRSGSPKITRELTKRGWRVSKNRVPRRMRLPGLRSIVRRRFRVTTNSKHRYPVALDRLQQQLHRAAAQSSVGERYHLPAGWVRLAVSGRLHRSVFATSGRLGAEFVAGPHARADGAAASRGSTTTHKWLDHHL